MISFETPRYLLLILVFSPIAFFFAIMSHYRKNRMIRAFGSEELIRSFSNLRIGDWKKRSVLYQSMVILLVFAAAGPQLSTLERIKKNSADFLCVLDVSRSMSAQDFGKGSRLETAKIMIKDMMGDLNGNRIGMVTFAGSPFEQAPLTNDYDALDFVLREWVEINSVQKTGSDLMGALEKGMQSFGESKRQKLMLVFTDGGGDFDENRARPILRTIKDRGIRLIIVGIGSRKGFLLKSESDPAPVLTALGEANLKKTAEYAGGTFIDGNRDPIRVSSDIGKKIIGRDLYEGKRSIYRAPLVLAIVLFGLAFFI